LRFQVKIGISKK